MSEPKIYEYDGSATKVCRCGVEIWWFGKIPINKATGITHFADCPYAKQFRKKKPESKKENQ